MPELVSDSCGPVTEDVDGAIWLGTSAGLVRMTPDGFTRFGRAAGIAFDRVTHLLWDARLGLWCGGEGGVARWQDGKFRAYTQADGLLDHQVRWLLPTAAGELAVATVKGIVVFDPPTRRFRPARQEVTPCHRFLPVAQPSGARGSSLAATETELWQQLPGQGWAPLPGSGEATQAHGLFRLTPLRVRSHTARDGLPHDHVLSVSVARDGGVWAATERGFECRCHRTPQVGSHVAAGEVSGMASAETNGRTEPSAANSPDGRLWFPTIRGMVKIAPANLGEGLSQVALLGELASQSETNGLGQESLVRLAEQARSAQRSLSEVVWAASARHDTLAGLLNYLADFAPQLCASAGVRCRPEFPTPAP